MAAQISSLLDLPWPILAILLVWILAWKGAALWKAARKNHPVWFIIILVLNTLGILEILYIFLFSDLFDKRDAEGKRKKNKPKTKSRRYS